MFEISMNPAVKFGIFIEIKRNITGYDEFVDLHYVNRDYISEAYVLIFTFSSSPKTDQKSSFIECLKHLANFFFLRSLECLSYNMKLYILGYTLRSSLVMVYAVSENNVATGKLIIT